MSESERPSKIQKVSHGNMSDASAKVEPAAATHDSSKLPFYVPPAEAVDSEKYGNDLSVPPSLPNEAVESQTNGADLSVLPSSPAGPLPAMSKNAKKRLLKQQAWEAQKPQRIELRKIQRIAKRERRKEARDAAIASGDPTPAYSKVPLKHTQLPITFIIDCDFDDLMRDNERKSLGLQIQRCYADNKQAPYMNHLTVASFGGELKRRYDEVMRKHYLSWKGMRFLADDFLATADKAKEWMSDTKGGELSAPVFAKYAESEESIAKAKEDAEVVYLSSDSDYTLTELKPFSTYIIGGLVDKNREKGICHKRAVSKGVKTARLPIGEYLDMASRKVLTTNHVHEIMLKWLELGDWGEAFMRVIPKRKDAKLRGAEGNDDEDEQGVVEGAESGRPVG